MLLSRGAPLLKNVVTRVIARKAIQKVPVRNSGEFFYREVPEPYKGEVLCSELLGGVMWWWIFWNVYHEFGHIVGEYKYPDPSAWTDEELGIPPED